MGKADRPKEITLPQIYLEPAVFSDDEDSDEEYIIELGNDIMIITDNYADNNDESDSETIFSDDDDEQEVESVSNHSDLDLFELDWGGIESSYIIEEVTDNFDSMADEYLSDTDCSDDDSYDTNDDESDDDDDDDSDSSGQSEQEELDNSVAFDYDNPPDVYTNFSQSDDDYEHFSDDANDESG